jgi:RNA polymerase sigma-70 factor (ECF subfamily)
MADSQLMDFHQDSDELVMRKLHDRQWKRMLHFCYNLVNDEVEAQDIVQEAYLSLWKVRARWSGIGNLDNYLFITCRNNALAFLKRKMELNRLAEDVVAHLKYQEQHSALDHIYAKETQHHLQQQIQTFPPKMKQVFLLSREDELTQKEISTKLNISENTVKKQINNVLKVLKKNI